MARRYVSRGLSFGAAKSIIRRAVRAGRRSANYSRRSKKGGGLLWVVLGALAVAVAIFWNKIKALFHKPK